MKGGKKKCPVYGKTKKDVSCVWEKVYVEKDMTFEKNREKKCPFPIYIHDVRVCCMHVLRVRVHVCLFCTKQETNSALQCDAV